MCQRLNDVDMRRRFYQHGSMAAHSRNKRLPYNATLMRIVMLSKALVTGAYQRKCELIAQQENVQLTVLVPPSWRTGRDVARLERAHTHGYTLTELPIRFNGNFHFHFYPTLSAVLTRLQPDVVHIDEEPYNLATYLALRGAQRVRARALFFTWQNLLRTYPPPFRWMERHVLAHADAAIAGNREAVHVLQTKGYTRPVPVIPQFGVDETLFCPPAAKPHAELEHPNFTIGYAGRLVPEKGMDLLLQALAGLPLHARVMIVGTGSALSGLRRLAQDLNVSERVQFAPAVPSARMPAVYAQLDALALPSRTLPNWKEQFGRVLVEAMACGVPVLGSTCGEIPQVIGDAGLIFPEGDVQQLRSQLLRLIEQPALRTDLLQRGRAHVLAHYTMARIADETVAIYRSLTHPETRNT
jgi:glycosyltransferase involved in cell wall biosynthesis